MNMPSISDLILEDDDDDFEVCGDDSSTWL